MVGKLEERDFNEYSVLEFLHFASESFSILLIESVKFPSQDKPITYLAESDDSACGAAIDWGARTGFYPSPAEAEPLARKVKDTAGVHFIPALWGIRHGFYFTR